MNLSVDLSSRGPAYPEYRNNPTSSMVVSDVSLLIPAPAPNRPDSSDDGIRRVFSDLYIPSYTRSLSALIESRKSVCKHQTYFHWSLWHSPTRLCLQREETWRSCTLKAHGCQWKVSS